MKCNRFVSIVGLTCALCGTASQAAVIFSDTFDGGASATWGNEIGAWATSSGRYGATTVAPNDFPSSHSTLPFDLTDFSAEIDVIDIKDGGFWLRSAAAPGTTTGRTGIVLVTGGRGGFGTGLYWHIVPTGASYGAILNESAGLFTSGVSDARIRIEVSGDTYSAFLGSSLAPATTLTTSAFTSGRFALFDSGPGVEAFDAVQINASAVSEPATGAMLSLGLLFLAFHTRRDPKMRRRIVT